MEPLFLLPEDDVWSVGVVALALLKSVQRFVVLLYLQASTQHHEYLERSGKFYHVIETVEN